jgi:hypothetical protein
MTEKRCCNGVKATSTATGTVIQWHLNTCPEHPGVYTRTVIDTDTKVTSAEAERLIDRAVLVEDRADADDAVAACENDDGL